MAEKVKILIIDDEEDFGWFLGLNLQEKGFEARYEKNGEAGIKAAEEFNPSLVLLDIAMPGIDGYETCEKIRSKPGLKKTRILFLTGKDLVPNKIMERCESLGQCDFISKPFTIETAIKKMEELLK